MKNSVPSGFAEEIGVDWLELDPDGARARIEVAAMHLQPYGIVHGGVYSSLAESLTSAATYEAVKPSLAPATRAAPPGSGTSS